MKSKNLFLDRSILQEAYVPVNLSNSNSNHISSTPSSAQEWNHYICGYQAKYNAKVAYREYLAKRTLYDRTDRFQSKNINRVRNIHLGLDFSFLQIHWFRRFWKALFTVWLIRLTQTITNPPSF